MEGAIVEQLRHYSSAPLHPTLIHAQLIYDTHGRGILSALYQCVAQLGELILKESLILA